MADSEVREILAATAGVLRDLQTTRWVTLRQVGEIPRYAIVYVTGWTTGFDGESPSVSIRWGPGEGHPVEHGVLFEAVARWDPETALGKASSGG